MKSEQRKKELKYRIDAMWSSDAIASEFFLNRNDNVLIKRISNGDESALLQFIIKHINILKRQIVGLGNPGIEWEVMDIYLPLFSEKIKTFAKLHVNKPLRKNWEYDGTYYRNLEINNEIVETLIYQKHITRLDFEITDRHEDILNNLNEYLTKTEEIIVARAKVDLPILEARIKDISNTTSDYEYFVDIDFTTIASDGNHIYTLSHSFTETNLEGNNWGSLCDGEDWNEGGLLSELKSKCCYLMHELVYHAHLAQLIFDINVIGTQTKIWDQSQFKLKSGIWETEFYDDNVEWDD